MADETKAPQIENPEKITVLATLESWERKVDAVVAVLTDTQMKLFLIWTKWGLFRGNTQMVSHHTPRHTAESPITPAVAAFRAVSVRSHVRQKKSRQACRF